jgi:cytosine/adenosine deaminase-related metal-dependent hydrolase
VTPGAQDRILLKGTVLGPTGPFAGQVLVQGQKLLCVEPGEACASNPGATGATVIETNGIISPGLIDMHNHILFDIFDGDDWTPEKAYTNHTQWTQEFRYGAMLDVKQCFEDASQGKPSWCPAKWDGASNNLKCEMNKWGETKGLVSGTTSIIGLIGTIGGCVGSLARTLGTSYSNLEEHAIQSSALVPSSGTSASNVCKNFANGSTKSYVIHLGEGTDATAKGQFEKLRALTDPPGCLMAPQTVITHGTAFDDVEFKEMGEKGMKLVWSPRSNISLYGDTPTSTTNIPLALSHGITVSLGPDWSMGGSVNMLEEMRFADAWDNKHWGDVLKPRDLFEMATINAAKSLALDNQIGSLKAGLYADLFVFGGDTANPYDALLAAAPSSVRLVMVGGRVLYGDTQLKPAALNAASCEDIQVCSASKFVCVAESNSSNKLNQTFDVIKTTLEEALLEVDAIPAATKGHSFTFAPIAPLSSCP